MIPLAPNRRFDYVPPSLSVLSEASESGKASAQWKQPRVGKRVRITPTKLRTIAR